MAARIIFICFNYFLLRASSFGDYTSLGNIGSAADSAVQIFIRVITQTQRGSIEC